MIHTTLLHKSLPDKEFKSALRKVMLGCVFFIGLLPSSPVYAHAPHDVVSGLSISPAFATDKTVFAAVRGSLLKSVNKGVTWKRLVQGIDSKFGVQFVVINPVLPNIIYLSNLSDGIYKSEDTGFSWHKVNVGLSQPRISKIYLPPNTGDTVAFALDKRGWLNKTTDAGASWSKVYVHTATITEIAGDLLDSNRVLIGDAKGAVFESTDGGIVWNKVFEDTGCGEINTIGGDNNSSIGQIFFVGTQKCGIFRTVDGGKSFKKSNSNIEDLNIRSIVLSPDFIHDSKVIVSTWSKSVFVSTNAGLSWTKYSQGITTTSQADAAGLPDFKDIRISPDFKNDKTVFLGGFNGLFRSVNAGISWAELDTMPKSLIQGFAISPNHNVDGTIAVNTYLSGVFNSTDKGLSWKTSLTRTDFRGYDVVFSPAYAKDQTLFASTNPDIIAKSTNGGESWVNYTIGTVGPSIIAISPGFYYDQTLFAATRFGVVYKSTDGGISYKPIYKEPAAPDCGDTCLTSLVVSPNYAVDQTIFLATQSSGISVSQDGGSTWSLKTPKQKIGTQIKLAVSPDYAEDQTVFFGGTVGLFKTTDGFTTWKKVPNSTLGIYDFIDEVVISPNFKTDKTVFVTVNGKGLLKSQDSGATFQLFGLNAIKGNNLLTIWPGFPTASLSSIKFSPKYKTDSTIFATSSELLLKSSDKGRTWVPILLNSKLP